MKNIGILGASGYAGAELARILLRHPGSFSLHVSSVSFEGKDLGCVHPAFRGLGLILESADEAAGASDIVFSCLPHGHAEKMAAKCWSEGKLLIDLSADFRFGNDEATYSKWYGRAYANPDLHEKAVYGLPELNREKIRGTRIIGNPGCYPTTACLGLFPALREGIADPSGIIIDSASGITGAGREPGPTTHYPECADSYSPYKIGSHRHQPEIDRWLSFMAGGEVESVFTPHLAPMGRGIVSTMYFRPREPVTAAGLRGLYKAFYADEPFVRILDEGSVATNRGVRHSNYCDISLHLSSNGKTAIVVSAIDNMVKGAAGQAVQNMNIALGLDETAGLAMVPPAV